MTFSEALKAMKMGSKVSREAWRGKISYWHIFMNEIFEFQPGGSNVAADITQEAVLAEDWWIVT